MPVTSPDSIYYADGSTSMSAEAISAAEATSVQNALNSAYRFRETLYYTSSGTFTKSTYPWLKAIRVRCVGGGGAGGGGTASGASGGGGGGGGYAESFITNIAGLPSSVSITVGAGGKAGTGAGGSGGASGFGSTTSASGGAGGGTSTTAADGGVGGVGTAGDIVIGGSGGGASLRISGTGALTGTGGSSQLGGGGRGVSFNTAGNGDAGTGYGSGGGGAYRNASDVNGGAGAPGIVIVEMYG